jgi:DNA-binding FrmR family transcriptional regulator
MLKFMSDDPILDQLNRIKGQVSGIIEMYQTDRGCIDVVRQVVAVRSSLGGVAQKILSGEVKQCTQERRAEDLDQILKEVFKYS